MTELNGKLEEWFFNAFDSFCIKANRNLLESSIKQEQSGKKICENLLGTIKFALDEMDAMRADGDDMKLF